jgi:hypothetical protein
MKRKFITTIAALLFIIVTPMFAWEIPNDLQKHCLTGADVYTYLNDNSEPITYYDLTKLQKTYDKISSNAVNFIKENTLRGEPCYQSACANYDFNKLAKFGLQIYFSYGITNTWQSKDVPYYIIWIYSLKTESIVHIVTFSDSSNNAFFVHTDLNGNDIIFQ